MLSQKQSIEHVFSYHDQTQQLQNSKPIIGKKKLNRSRNNKNKGASKGFYFKLGVVKKVATFLENLKNSIVQTQPPLKISERKYLENEFQHTDEDQLIGYQNKIKLLYDILIFIITLLVVWKNSFELALDTLVNTNYSIESIALVLCSIDIILLYNSEYKNQKLEIISNRRAILDYYLKQKFKFDLFLFFGLTMQIFAVDHWRIGFYISRLLSLVAIVTLQQKTQKFQNIYANSAKMQSLFGILNLLGLIFSFIHCLALLFNLMSRIEKQNGISVTWVESNELIYNNKFDLYIFGWYWGSTIMSTVGFGDIVPANVYERLIVSFVEVLCCVGFGYFVNYVGTLIGVLRESKQNYQKDIRRLNRYIEPMPVPDKLKNNLRTHFYNSYQTQQIYSPSEEKEIFTKLPNNLKSTLLEACNYIYLTQSKLATTFSQTLIRNLALKMHKVVYAPEEIIFNTDRKENKLWILVEGEVVELPNHTFQPNQQPNSIISNKVLMRFNSKSQKQNTLSWINFITGQQYKTIGRAETFTIAYQLDREDFKQVIDDNRDLYEDKLKFHQLKDTMMNNCQNFTKKCLACDRYTHNVAQCSKLHYKPKRKLTPRNNKYEYQERKSNASRTSYRFNWKNNLQQLIDQFNRYMNNSNEIHLGVAGSEHEVKPRRKTLRGRQTSFFSKCSVDGMMEHIIKNFPQKTDTIINMETEQDVSRSKLAESIAVDPIAIVSISQKQYVWINFEKQLDTKLCTYFPDGICATVIKSYNDSSYKRFQRSVTRAMFNSHKDKLSN